MSKDKFTINVKGMHCVSCETIIQNELEDINGVIIQEISSKKGIVSVVLDKISTLDSVKKKIQELGYLLSDDLDNNSDNKHDNNSIINKKKKNNFLKLFFIFIFWILLFGIFEHFNFFSRIPGLDGDLSIWMALLLGLVASVSTCLAITGSIVIGFAQYIDDSKTKKGKLKTQLLFQFGRLVGFFVLGGLLGLVGQVFKLSLTISAILNIIIGLVIFYMGLNLIGLVPSITKLGFHFPKKWTKKFLTTKNPIFAPIVGVLTFFLPCGFTQSIQLVAMGTGSFWSGGLVMLMFAIGTMPVLLFIGLGINFIKEKKLSLIYSFVGILIILFALYSIKNGFTLLTTTNYNIGSTQVDYSGDISIKYETINVSHNGWSLTPDKIYLKQSQNYEIIITPEKNGIGCMSNLVIPKINKKVFDVIKGEPIVYKIKDIKPGKYNVVCGNMGMYQGTLIVE